MQKLNIVGNSLQHINWYTLCIWYAIVTFMCSLRYTHWIIFFLFFVLFFFLHFVMSSFLFNVMYAFIFNRVKAGQDFFILLILFSLKKPFSYRQLNSYYSILIVVEKERDNNLLRICFRASSGQTILLVWIKWSNAAIGLYSGVVWPLPTPKDANVF